MAWDFTRTLRMTDEEFIEELKARSGWCKKIDTSRDACISPLQKQTKEQNALKDAGITPTV